MLFCRVDNPISGQMNALYFAPAPRTGNPYESALPALRKTMINPKLSLTHPDIRPIAIAVAVISVLLSVWGVMADNVINNDGVEYVRAARLIQAGEWGQSIDVFRWPTYPALMAALAAVTGLSHEYAAHVLNAVFTVVLVVAFLAAVMELGADRRTVIAAAAVILLAPRINDYRPFVIRDPGYLAFYTLAMLYLFRYVRLDRTRDGVRALAMMLIAVAFRMEGIAFVVLMPLLLAFTKARASGRRLGLTIACVVAALVLSAGFFLWFVSLGGGQGEAKEATSLGALMSASWIELSQTLSDKLHVIEVELLGEYSSDYAFGVLAVTLLLIVTVEVVKSVSLWTGLLICWAGWRRMLFPIAGMLRPWLLLLVIHLLILGVFTLVKLFLTERYSLALTVTLLLAAPFGLLGLYELWRRNETGEKLVRYAYPVLVVLVVVAGIEGLGLFTEKNHIKDAGHWIAENRVGKNRLLTNSKILAHYSDSETYVVKSEWYQLADVLRGQSWKKYDYMAVRVGRHGEYQILQLRRSLGREPVKQFVNDRGDTVLVFATGQG